MNRIVWDGLDELREELRRLPAELADEAGGIVLHAAESAKTEIAAGYEAKLKPPANTGYLVAGLSVIRSAASRFGVGAVLRNRAPHASIFEKGTQARHTGLGYNRGSMPPGRVFVPIVIKKRRAMYESLKDLLTRHGLAVSGDV